MSDQSRISLDPTALFSLTGLLADRDGDGLPETVRALLVLGEGAALPEQLAAVNLAARLGFETLAFELPLAMSDPAYAEPAFTDPLENSVGARIPVYPGRPGTLSRQCPEALARLLKACSPGEGIIAVSAGTPVAVLIGGADPVGLHIAALAACTDRVSTGTALSDTSVEIRAVRVSALTDPALERVSVASARFDLALDGESAATAVPLRSLADLFGPAGLAVDDDGDLLPDRSRTRLVLPADLSPREAVAAVHLAARIGLETLGLAFPLAVDALYYKAADHEIPLIVQPLTAPAAANGAGSVRLVSQAESHEIRLGGNGEGRATALEALAGLDVGVRAEQSSPADLERGMERLLALADPGSALCAVLPALHSLGAGIASLPATPLDLSLAMPSSIPLDLEATTACLRDLAADAVPDRASSVNIRQVSAESWLDETHNLAWEFEDAWRLVQSEIMPRLVALPAGSTDWHIDLRLSEPEPRRQTLYTAIAAQLRSAGIAVTLSQVRILPTYHQGRAWLLESILPRLLEVRPTGVIVRVKRFATTGALELPLRWLQDLFPADELLAARLDLAASAIQFELVDDLPVTYDVEAFDRSGAPILRDSLDVTVTTHPYLARFPAWGTVSPPTGRIRLTVGSETVVDRPLASDPERIWRLLHDTLLPEVEAAIHRHCGGDPRRDQQPFFSELTVEAWLSEDDGPLGVREERNSPLESLHEDIYFVLLDYFTALITSREPDPYVPPWLSPDNESRARRDVRRWGIAPGRVVPLIHRRDGMAPTIRIRLEGPAPTASLTWRCGGATGILPLRPSREVSGTVVGLEFPAPRTSQTTTFPTAVIALNGPPTELAHAESLLRALGRLRLADMEPPLTIPNTLGLRLVGAAGETVHIPPRARLGDSHPTDMSKANGPSLADSVPWDRVLRRNEVNDQIQRLGRLPGIHAFVAGHSALGRPLWAMEVTVPRERGWWSRAKLSGWKCSLLLNGRHHANEPASTSALLRMAELLATDDQWRCFLKRVNVIFLPGENADGMDLDDLLVAEHPNWMHHAARYNAAGLEFIAAHSDPTTPHTEALAQPKLWHRWAPDIVCDCHGFPSHAWDQPFSGGQNPWFRDNSIPQAVIYGIMPTADTPTHRAAAARIIEGLTDRLSGDTEIALWNEEHARQYKNYLQSRSPERFPAPFARGLMLHQSFYDPASGRPGLASYPGMHPNVTTASLVTEVADETAQGAYLDLCARSHLLANRALLEYLFAADAPAHVQRQTRQTPDGRVMLSTRRPRPVLPT